MRAFEETACAAAPQLGAAALRTLSERLAAGWPDHTIVDATGTGQTEAVRGVLAARTRDSVTAEQAAMLLRGIAAGYASREAAVSVQTVWSGPSSHSIPVRASAQALIEVIGEARRELVLMTYSARQYEPVREALADAISRDVSVSVVVETLQGAGSALGGSEPATAFAGISGLQLWHWPAAQRTEHGSKMHAKLAVADRRVLLTTSANLTQSGVAKNVEAGLLVRGGTAPLRAAEHVAELQASGVLARLSTSASHSVGGGE